MSCLETPLPLSHQEKYILENLDREVFDVENEPGEDKIIISTKMITRKKMWKQGAALNLFFSQAKSLLIKYCAATTKLNNQLQYFGGKMETMTARTLYATKKIFRAIIFNDIYSTVLRDSNRNIRYTKFTQFILPKPSQNGIKAFRTCDTSNSYTLQYQLHAGKLVVSLR